MRDRLIELLDGFLDLGYSSSYIADHLLANGVVVPPCKVGDIVKCDAIYYRIYITQSYSDFETPIHHRYWAEPINDEGEDDFWFWSDRVEEGTVVICSKEEAEQALKGGEWMKEGCCFYCSECKKTYGFGSTQTIYDVKRHWLHCPNCGAKMDGAKMSEMPTGSERVRVMICIDCPIRQYYDKMFDIHFEEKNCICKCPYRVIKERF